jgi:uncharacterized membrane protein HdeD (DUF308 family)
MYISFDLLLPVLALIAGVIALVSPKNAHYAIGVYLIAVGVIEILPHV